MLSIQQKVVDSIFFLNQKGPKHKFWQAQQEGCLNHHFGASCCLSQCTLPSCLCPSLPQNHQRWGGQGELCIVWSQPMEKYVRSKVVLWQIQISCLKISNFSQQCLFGLLSFQRALRATISWHCCCGIVATPTNQGCTLKQWIIHLETISSLSLTCERFIPFRRKIYIHHTGVGCTIPRGACTIALEGLLRALPSAKAVILKSLKNAAVVAVWIAATLQSCLPSTSAFYLSCWRELTSRHYIFGFSCF